MSAQKPLPGSSERSEHEEPTTPLPSPKRSHFSQDEDGEQDADAKRRAIEIHSGSLPSVPTHAPRWNSRSGSLVASNSSLWETPGAGPSRQATSSEHSSPEERPSGDNLLRTYTWPPLTPPGLPPVKSFESISSFDNQQNVPPVESRGRGRRASDEPISRSRSSSRLSSVRTPPTELWTMSSANPATHVSPFLSAATTPSSSSGLSSQLDAEISPETARPRPLAPIGSERRRTLSTGGSPTANRSNPPQHTREVRAGSSSQPHHVYHRSGFEFEAPTRPSSPVSHQFDPRWDRPWRSPSPPHDPFGEDRPATSSELNRLIKETQFNPHSSLTISRLNPLRNPPPGPPWRDHPTILKRTSPMYAFRSDNYRTKLQPLRQRRVCQDATIAILQMPPKERPKAHCLACLREPHILSKQFLIFRYQASRRAAQTPDLTQTAPDLDVLPFDGETAAALGEDNFMVPPDSPRVTDIDTFDDVGDDADWVPEIDDDGKSGFELITRLL